MLLTVMDLFLICNILLSGLSNGLVDLAGIVLRDGSAPRRRWIYFVCGPGSMLSGKYGVGDLSFSQQNLPQVLLMVQEVDYQAVCVACYSSFLMYVSLHGTRFQFVQMLRSLL